MSAWRIDELLFDHAESLEEAEALLDAAAGSSPYHILVLDLAIPKRKGLTGDTEFGFKILNIARKLGAAKQIIIFTKHPEDVNILKALREGANDLIAKKATKVGAVDHELQTQFMCCWQRVMVSESAGLMEMRIKDLIPYAEAGLVHRFTACFSDFVQAVDHTADDVEHYASERFGLDREKDGQDFLFRLLKKQDADLKAAQENWAALKADLSGGGEAPRAEILESLLDSIEEMLMPCLLVKNTALEREFYGGGQTAVLSFPNEVCAVIQEMLSGLLSTLPDFGDTHTVRLGLRVRNGQAEVQLSDDLTQPISSDDAQAINGGFTIGPEHEPTRFGRAWGLSVMQHIALRGGGRLIVTPQPPRGNQITYFIPLAQ